MLKKYFHLCLAVFMGINLAGCDNFKAWFAKEFKQGQLSDGVARLTTQHMSIIVKELKDKFSEAEIQPSFKTEEYGKGLVTWTLRDITVEHEKEEEVYRDCLDNIALWQGKLHVIKATQQMYGRLTNNPKNPVIPDEQTVSFSVHAKADGLTIKFPSKEGHLVIHSGELKFDAIPRLAQSRFGQSKGMRVAPTSNFRFENVKLKDIKATLFTKEITLPIEINDSDFMVQVGIGENGEENFMKGEITVFGQKRNVALDGKGLDPNYSKEDFLKTYACDKDLQGVVEYKHEQLESKLAPGMAGLSTLVMSQILSRVKDDHQCGMASVAFLRNTKIDAAAGETGKAISELQGKCEITFEKYKTEPNCHGVAYELDGTAIVRSIKRELTGRIITDATGYQGIVSAYEKNLPKDPNVKPSEDALPAAMPSTRRPAVITMMAELRELSIKEICVDNDKNKHPMHCKAKERAGREKVAFEVFSGKMSASFRPMLAKDKSPESKEPGLCTLSIPIIEGSVKLQEVKAAIKRSGNEIRLLANGDYSVVLGKIGDKENQLSGEMKVGQVPVYFKQGNVSYVPLNPDYNADEYLDSFRSCKQIEIPQTDDECSLDKPMAANIMRMIVFNAGAVLRLAGEGNVTNSFKSKYALDNREFNPSKTEIILKADVSSPVNLGLAKYQNIRKDMDRVGNIVEVGGVIEKLTGTMQRKGIKIEKSYNWRGSREMITAFLASKSLVEQPVAEIFVRPTALDSTKIELTADLYDFSAKYIEAGKKPHPQLIIEEGNIAVTAIPIMGIDERTLGDAYKSYSVRTPIVRFDSIRLGESVMKLSGDGMSLPIYIKRADISAQNGFFRKKGNYVSGSIQYATELDNKGIPRYGPIITLKDQKLNPKFDLDQFNKTYESTKYLHAPITEDD